MPWKQRVDFETRQLAQIGSIASDFPTFTINQPQNPAIKKHIAGKYYVQSINLCEEAKRIAAMTADVDGAKLQTGQFEDVAVVECSINAARGELKVRGVDAGPASR